MKTARIIFSLLVLTFATASCSSNDDNTTIEGIETLPDEVVMSQNSSTEISIFANDNNIPVNGSLSTSSPSLGTIQIENNNTPENPSDDTIIYTVNPNNIGEDSFQYTICDDQNNCKTESVLVIINSLSIVSVFENETPHAKLSEYNFFEGDLKDLNPTFGVVPYELISPLFSDYAKKKRFIWMPNGVAANYVNDYSPIDFPEGTILIKNFYYNTVQPGNTKKNIETRLMYKKANGWDFANYVWDDQQNEAYFTNQASTLNISWLEGEALKTTNYRVPSRAECFTCHNQVDNPTPIGTKPQNLNKAYNYNTGLTNQLIKLKELGYLNSNFPENINSSIAWDDSSQPLEDRVRSYLDINCAHCHSDDGHCNYRPMRFEYQFTNNIENIGVCVEPETQFIPNSYIVTPNNTSLSVLFYRISTADESFRMPLLGRTINHDEGIALVEDWINSLQNCD